MTKALPKMKYKVLIKDLYSFKKEKLAKVKCKQILRYGLDPLKFYLARDTDTIES